MPSIKNKGSLRHNTPGTRMERISIDIVSPLPRSRRGNKFVLTVSVNFTKWVEAYAMPNSEAHTVAKHLINQYITRYRRSPTIYIQTKVYSLNLCRLLGVENTRTTSYHHMSNGQVERCHRTLHNTISMYVNSQQTDWDEYLSLVSIAYISTPHSSTLIS
jgi:hypothetical protein